MTLDNGKIFSVDYDENLYIHNIDGTGEIKIEPSRFNESYSRELGLYGIAAGGGRFAVADYEQVYVFNQDGSGETLISAPIDAMDILLDSLDRILLLQEIDYLLLIHITKIQELVTILEQFILMIYRFSSTTPGILTTTDAPGKNISFDYQILNENHLVATTDYVWYGAIEI